MFGAIIGDIIGSRFEWDNIKTKEFELFDDSCRPTDDSIMTIAVAKAIMNSVDPDMGRVRADLLAENAVKYMREFGARYPKAGYGGRFKGWLNAENPQPYNSLGNGAAMRVSPCGDMAANMQDAIDFAEAVTAVTHDHPEGIKGAEAVCIAIFLAKGGAPIEQIREYIQDYYYDMDFTLDEIREEYKFDVTCQGSVPQALEAFFESTDFEDAIRNAISIGGDSDTIAAIAGSVAEAYYGIPGQLADKAMSFLAPELREVVYEWYMG